MIERVSLDGTEVVLVGTAHVSQESVDEVEQVIAAEEPDAVCVELDEKRYDALVHEDRWKQLDIREALREGKGGLLLMNVLLSIYQRKIGEDFDIGPGDEMLTAIDAAKQHGAAMHLVDRDVQDTMRDLLQSLTWREKLRLATSTVAGFFDDTEMDADTIEELKERDMLETVITDLGGQFPSIKTVLLDTRDAYMAEQISDIDAETIVAVVGAAHVDGIAARLRSGDIESITPPEPSRLSPLTAVKYGVPALIVAMFAAIIATQGLAVAGQAAGVWFLLNGTLAALGAVAARAHPLTVLVSFVAAPFTSINPALPAGLVAAYAEHRFDPPTVDDLESIAAATSYRALWSNAALNLLLIFFLVNLGSAIATYGGGGYLANLLL